MILIDKDELTRRIEEKKANVEEKLRLNDSKSEIPSALESSLLHERLTLEWMLTLVNSMPTIRQEPYRASTSTP